MKKYKLIKDNTLTNTIKSSNYKSGKFVKSCRIIPIINGVLCVFMALCKSDFNSFYIGEILNGINIIALSVITYDGIKGIKSYFAHEKLYELTNNFIKNNIFIPVSMIENSDMTEDNNISFIEVSYYDNIVQTRSDDGISYHYYDDKNNISDITNIVNENIHSKKKQKIISNMKKNTKF